MLTRNRTAGFGYKPRRYGLSPGLQSSSYRPPSYFGAKGSSGLLPQYGGVAGALSTQAGIGAKAASLRQSQAGGAVPRAAQSAAGAAAGAGTQPADYYSFDTDPTIARIRAIQQKARNDAIASAGAARKQLAIDFGDAGISGDLRGDTMTQKAAADNPFSALAQLRQRFEKDAPVELDNAYNQSNLFFSGARAKGIADLSREYQQTRADTEGQFRGYLSDIDSGLQTALTNADYADQMALLEAMLSGQGSMYGAPGGAADPTSGGGVAAGLAGGQEPAPGAPSGNQPKQPLGFFNGVPYYTSAEFAALVEAERERDRINRRYDDPNYRPPMGGV